MPIELTSDRPSEDRERPVAALTRWCRERLGGGKGSLQDRMFLTEQLALLLETGTPLHPALTALKHQMRSAGMRARVEQMAESVAEGRGFSEALRQHDDLFDATYTNLVAAAENGGFVHEVLRELLLLDQKRLEMKRALTGSLIYPAVLIVFSMAVVVFVLVVVFPKFEDLFARLGDRLPWSTRLMLLVSETLMQHWPLVLAALAAVLVGARLWAVSAPGRLVIDHVKLALPGLRAVFIELYLVQSFRVLGLSLSRGVSVMDALASCRNVVANVHFAALMGNLEQRVNEGGKLASGFAGASFVPEIVKQMVRTGEETGRLADVMLRVADHYDANLKQRLALLAKVVEPLMLILMGGLVGIIVASLILPIFQLSSALR